MHVDLQLCVLLAGGLIMGAIGLCFAHYERKAREKAAAQKKNGKPRKLAHA